MGKKALFLLFLDCLNSRLVVVAVVAVVQLIVLLLFIAAVDVVYLPLDVFTQLGRASYISANIQTLHYMSMILFYLLKFLVSLFLVALTKIHEI
jgi:hypothetical protein